MKEEKPVHHDVRKATGAPKTSVKRISPSAKLLITEHGLDTSSLEASGPHGTLLKGDVIAAIRSGIGSVKASSSKEKTPSPQIHRDQTTRAPTPESRSHSEKSDSFEDFPNSQVRKVSFISPDRWFAASSFDLSVEYISILIKTFGNRQYDSIQSSS